MLLSCLVLQNGAEAERHGRRGRGVMSEVGGARARARADRPCARGTEEGLAGVLVCSLEGIGFPAVLLYFPCWSLLPRSKSKHRISAPTVLVQDSRVPRG